MKYLKILLLTIVLACATPTEPTEATTANLLAVATYTGSCLTPGGAPAVCQVVFYRDYDLGGPQVFNNTSTWTMRAPLDPVKGAAFKFKARYKFPSSYSPWSQTITWQLVGGVTIPGTPAGPIYPGAPPANRLPYVLVP